MSESIAKLTSGVEKWAFDLPVITLGRSEVASVKVSTNRASRIHAMIRLNQESRYEVLDWGSKNGTFLNGKLLMGPEPLNSGDKITIGEQDFHFKGNDVSSNGSGAQPFTKLEGAGSNNQNVVAVCIRLLPGYDSFYKNNELGLSWMLGQWLQRQEAQVDHFGGVFDQISKGMHVSYWNLDSDTPAAFSQVVFECVKSCLKDTETLAKAAMESVKASQPFVRASAAMHYGEACLTDIGPNEIGYKTLSGDTCEIVKDVSERAMQAACPMLCTEKFQRALGNNGKAHPYCMALTGPRKQSIVLYHLT